MNNFKKFVAVLLGVVMACVFATSAFAADFSKADTAAKAKAEIKAFAASYGITTIDNTVNSLTADQLQTIYNNMDALKATAASANATIKGTTDVAVATKAANDAVATMNSKNLQPYHSRYLKSLLQVSLRYPVFPSLHRPSTPAILPRSLSPPMSPLTTQRISLLSLLRFLPPPPTTTPTPALLSAMPPRTVLPLPASRPFLPLRTPSPLLPALSSRPPAITPPLSLLLLLWLLPACSAWPSARSVHCNPAA